MHTVLLYQMGRVGSTSIDYALSANGIKTLHAHWLSGDFPEAEFSTTKPKILKLIKNGETEPLKVITPIREPMARNISAFVFNLIKYGVSGRQEPAEQLRELFMEKYNIFYPDEWFERELMTTFTFNPFRVEFPHSKGYKIYKEGKHRFLIIRLEDAERVFTKAIQQLLKVKGITLPRLSTLEDKKYIGEKYKQLRNIKYPKEFVDKVYSQKYVNHFYTEREIEEFKNKWSG